MAADRGRQSLQSYIRKQNQFGHHDVCSMVADGSRCLVVHHDAADARACLTPLDTADGVADDPVRHWSAVPPGAIPEAVPQHGQAEARMAGEYLAIKTCPTMRCDARGSVRVETTPSECLLKSTVRRGSRMSRGTYPPPPLTAKNLVNDDESGMLPNIMAFALRSTPSQHISSAMNRPTMSVMSVMVGLGSWIYGCILNA